MFIELLEKWSSLKRDEAIDESNGNFEYYENNGLNRIELYYYLLGCLEGYKSFPEVSEEDLLDVIKHLNLDVYLAGDDDIFEGEISKFLIEDGSFYNSDYSYEKDYDNSDGSIWKPNVIDENPWISVFGEGDEADTAYLNTE